MYLQQFTYTCIGIFPYRRMVILPYAIVFLPYKYRNFPIHLCRISTMCVWHYPYTCIGIFLYTQCSFKKEKVFFLNHFPAVALVPCRLPTAFR